MKRSELNELVRHITRHVLKEFSSMSSAVTTDPMAGSSLDPNTPPTDAMTSSEKSRMDRDKEHMRQRQLKQKEQEMKTAKKEMDFQKQKVDQTKRFSIPTIKSDIDKLKHS